MVDLNVRVRYTKNTAGFFAALLSVRSKQCVIFLWRDIPWNSSRISQSPQYSERTLGNSASDARGLSKVGVRAGDKVAIFSENRLGWAISDFGIQCRRRHHRADLRHQHRQAGRLCHQPQRGQDRFCLNRGSTKNSWPSATRSPMSSISSPTTASWAIAPFPSIPSTSSPRWRRR
jgi:hypothetical protein